MASIRRCSWIFCNIHKKIPEHVSIFYKVGAGKACTLLKRCSSNGVFLSIFKNNYFVEHPQTTVFGLRCFSVNQMKIEHCDSWSNKWIVSMKASEKRKNTFFVVQPSCVVNEKHNIWKNVLLTTQIVKDCN